MKLFYFLLVLLLVAMVYGDDDDDDVTEDSGVEQILDDGESSGNVTDYDYANDFESIPVRQEDAGCTGKFRYGKNKTKTYVNSNCKAIFLYDVKPKHWKITFFAIWIRSLSLCKI